MGINMTDKPFVLLATLVLADLESDYQRAADAQRRLAELGWYVSKRPPETEQKTKPRQSRKRAATATTPTS